MGIFSYENKQNHVWKDLDDNEYNNHFLGGQCFIGVSFNNDGSYDEQMILPCYPEDVNFNNSANYNSADIVGRPGSISNYSNTSDITTRFTLHLHREMPIPNNSGNVIDSNQIDKVVTLIKACNYPKDFQTGIRMPIVTYTFGDTQIVGKQTSLDEKWGGPKIGKSYMECTLTISITHVFKEIPYFDKILELKTPRTLP